STATTDDMRGSSLPRTGRAVSVLRPGSHSMRVIPKMHPAVPAHLMRWCLLSKLKWRALRHFGGHQTVGSEKPWRRGACSTVVVKPRRRTDESSDGMKILKLFEFRQIYPMDRVI